MLPLEKVQPPGPYEPHFEFRISDWGFRSGRRAVLALTVLALLLRLAVLIQTFDGHADGRTRAKQGYLWASHPSIVTHGVWLPGFLYLSGAAELLWPEPRYAPRLVSAVLGAATVPVAAALAARAVGHPAALVTAATLAMVTCDEDRDMRKRLMTLAGRELQVGPVVYRERWVEVVELSWSRPEPGR